MIERFRAYLDKDFGKVARTIQVDELYEELLGALIDKSEEARASGMPEEEIFDYVITNFGDYREALNELDVKNRSQKKYILKKLTIGALWTILWFFGMTIVYLTVSFITKKWNTTWIIMVGAAAGYILALVALNMRMSYKNKWYLLFRFSAVVFVILLLTIVYFIYSGVTGAWYVSWLIMINIPCVSLLTDFGAAMFLGRKFYFIEVLLTVFFLSVSLFLITATVFFGYRMTWLFVLGGIFVDLVLITIRKLNRSSHGREQGTDFDR